MAESYYQGAYTGAEIDAAIGKVGGVEAGAQVNVQSDWNEADSTADDFIKNKPALGTAAAKGVDSTPTTSSTNLVTSGGVAAALAAKLNTADVDAALSDTSTNPVQNKVVQALAARLVDAGAKNLIRFIVTTIDDMPTGLTATVNEDMSITVNGMASGSDFIYKKIGIFVYRGGVKYKMPVDSPADLYFYTNDSRFDSRTGQSYTYTADGWVNVWFRCKAGVQYDNATIHPMLCTAEDYAISPEFVPYAPSNRELYEMILALQNAQNGGNS
jgi:hypothetical protein